MLKKLILSLSILTIFAGTSHAQMALANGEDYKLGLGLRTGISSGFNIKYFLGTGHAIEGIVEGAWGKFGLTALYEKQQDLGNVAGLDWYFGAGGHIRNYGPGWSGNNGNRFFYYPAGQGLALGIDGIIGLEYKFLEIPLAISLDYKPFYELDVDGKGFIQSGAGLSFRLTLD